MLRRLHVSRPDPFAFFVVKYIPMHFELRGKLNPADLDAHSPEERLRLVKNTIRRLQRQGKLRKDTMGVPVLQSNGEGGKTIVERTMTCYVPSRVLDKLARC